MPWIDAFANAAMILSGMGPLAPLRTWGGKLFAGLYGLYSGLLLIAVAGLILAPIIHRVLHRFHLEAGRKDCAGIGNVRQWLMSPFSCPTHSQLFRARGDGGKISPHKPEAERGSAYRSRIDVGPPSTGEGQAE
jgi:hypothetical protein